MSVGVNYPLDNSVRGEKYLKGPLALKRLISPKIFKQLGLYESPESALLNEVW